MNRNTRRALRIRRAVTSGLASVLFTSACGIANLGPGAETPSLPASQPGAHPPPGDPSHFALGRTPTAQEIAAWDIDIMPDGAGLPEGSGTVTDGRALYIQQCKQCHGLEGGGGPFDRLAGRLPDESFPFALDPLAKRTIGNYWPYATTIFDYTRRSMPMNRPGSLGDDDVYALTAYLLYLNDLVAEDATLDRESLPKIVMPAHHRFTPDDRRGGPEIR